ncbi:hypothetical protein GWI33_012596 [Rhynchophorus ferrugineus]|uniref:Transposase n=1 Tax=Rhynchophorus ferrugineus TaxID=354439 RepID=A0A834I8Y5_RHYFE|nr:hypothetical protein GWI33_012596 [Rhynchophorus ferrugineus]
MLNKFNCGASKEVYKIVTGDESWIYSYEPKARQQSTVWVFQNKPNPIKVVRAQTTSKKMVTCVFGKTGHIATVPLENRRTVNSDCYTTICSTEVIGEIRKTNRRYRIVLHHYKLHNQLSYIGSNNRLSTQNIELMGRPPNSPDLAPIDFFLFPSVKNKLRGQRFSLSEEAIEAFKNHVLKIPYSEWNKCFENWFKRMQNCIDHRGEYFEKY